MSVRRVFEGYDGARSREKAWCGLRVWCKGAKTEENKKHRGAVRSRDPARGKLRTVNLGQFGSIIVSPDFPLWLLCVGPIRCQLDHLLLSSSQTFTFRFWLTL